MTQRYSPPTLGDTISERQRQNLLLTGQQVPAQPTQETTKVGVVSDPKAQNKVAVRDKNYDTGTAGPTHHVEKKMNTEPEHNTNGSVGTTGAPQPPTRAPDNAAFEAAAMQAVTDNLGNMTKISEALSQRVEAGQPLLGMSKSELAQRTAISAGVLVAGGLLFKLGEHGLTLLFTK